MSEQCGAALCGVQCRCGGEQPSHPKPLRVADSTTVLDLDELRALADAASPGPWRPSGDDGQDHEAGEYDWIHHVESSVPAGEFCDNVVCRLGGDEQSQADAEFIASARVAVPALIARIRELEATSHLSHSTVTRQHEETE